jgi:GNAT superfamily N-acetyltransferase
MRVSVRKAGIADLDGYVVLARQFHQASPMRDVCDFDAVAYAEFFRSAIRNQSMAVWLAESDGEVVGIAGALLYPLYFNPSHMVVQELWWFLTPDARGSGAGSEMFKSIQSWAKEVGAASLFMIALENENASQMERVYARSGFVPLERTFIKEVV